MSRKRPGGKALGGASLILLALALHVWCECRAAAQGADASRARQGPGATARPRAPRRPRPGRSARASPGRPATPRVVRVAIVSNLPHCDVAVDEVLEESVTDEQGRLVIPMEPGLYEVRVTKSGYVTDGREIEVRPSAYVQEERFELRRELASLRVKTNPPEAEVSLDGDRGAVSGADGWHTFKQVDPSIRHSLRASKENYAEETVTVPPYTKEVLIRLRRDLLTLKVKTDPPQAEVYLDDDFKGTSDAEGFISIAKVKTDREHSLRAAKDGYVTQIVAVAPNYEFAFIKLPSQSGPPSPSAGQSKPGAQSGEGESGRRPDAEEGDGGSPPKADTSERAVTPPEGDGAPPAPQKAEPRPPAPQPRKTAQDGPSVSALEIEVNFWNSVKDSDDPEEFAAYLRKYPDGQFAELARIRMARAIERKKSESEVKRNGPAPDPGEKRSGPGPAKPTGELSKLTEAPKNPAGGRAVTFATLPAPYSSPPPRRTPRTYSRRA